MIHILKIVFIIIGTFVGAGFASGKEIYLFFYKYGIFGIFGILASSSFIGYIIYKGLKIAKVNNVDNYDDFFELIIRNKNVRIILKSLTSIFLTLSFCLMISGFCGFMKQEFNISTLFSYFFIISICVCIFLRDVTVIMKINDFLIPIIIITTIYFMILSFIKQDNNISKVLLFEYKEKRFFY